MIAKIKNTPPDCCREELHLLHYCILLDPLAPLSIGVAVGVDTVRGNVRGKRAVCVVEQIVALKIEDRLAVGEGLGIIIEVINLVPTTNNN